MSLWFWVQFTPACLSALAFSATVLRAATLEAQPSDEWGTPLRIAGGVAVAALTLVGKRRYDERDKQDERRAFARSLQSEVKHNLKITRAFVVRGDAQHGYSSLCLSQVDSRMHRFSETTQQKINSYRNSFQLQSSQAEQLAVRPVRAKKALDEHREQSLRFMTTANKLNAALHHESKPTTSFLRRAA